MRRRAQRAIESGRIFRYLAGALLLASLISGVVVRLVDPKDFDSLGDALWWAIVTLATVGYGDIVPTSPWGRVVGSAVIVVGVTFLSILTATVTSYFVSSSQDQRAAAADEHHDDTLALLRELLDRLDRLEATNPPGTPSLVARDVGGIDAEDETGE
jgi:voltage-gated potassium channel